MRFALSPKSRRFAVAAAVWTLSVLAYSVGYWVLWYSRPDSFIMNKEFNLTPIQDLHTKLWDAERPATWSPSPTAKAPTATELDSLMGTVAELDRTAVEAEEALAPLRLEQAALEMESKRAFQRHSDLMWSNVEKYKTSAWAPEQKEVQRQTALVAALEQQFGIDPPSHQAIVLAEARVVLAHARYREAVKMAEVGEYVLRNLVSFSDSAATSEAGRVDEQLRTNATRQNELSARLSNIRKRAHDNLDSWYSARRDRLLWIDFLYFSVGVSTTTTFGDIIPNSRKARIFVLSQLVLSVFLVGYLVSLVGRTE